MKSPWLIGFVLTLAVASGETREVDSVKVRRNLKSLQFDPLLGPPFLYIVEQYRKAGMIEYLEKELRENLKRPGWEESGPLLLSRFYLHQKKIKLARQTLQEARIPSPKTSDSLILIYQIELTAGRPEDALRSILKASRLVHGERRLTCIKLAAKLLYQQDKPRQATNLLMELLAESPSDRFVLHGIVGIFIENRLPEHALAAIDVYLTALPTEDRARKAAVGLQADLLFQSRQFQKTFELTRQTLTTIRPGTTEWPKWIQRLEKLGIQPQIAPKVKEWLRQQVKDSELPAWRLSLVRTHLEHDEKEQALKLFEPWKNPALAKGWILAHASDSSKTNRAAEIAKLFIRLDRSDYSLQWYQLALRFAPRRTDLKWELAGLHEKRGEIAPQRTILHDIIRIEPKSDLSRMAKRTLHDGFLQKGITQFMNGEWQKAAATFKQAEVDPEAKSEMMESRLWRALSFKKFDATKGENLWPKAEDVPARLSLVPLEGLEVSARWLAELRGKQERKTAPENRNRKQKHSFPAWSYRAPNPENPIRTIAANPRRLVCLLESGALHNIDLQSGLPQWTKPSLAGVSLLGFLGIAGEQLVYAESKTIHALNILDGSETWKYQLEFVPAGIASDENRVVAIGKSDEIVCLSSIGGSLAWQDSSKNGVGASLPFDVRISAGQLFVVKNGISSFRVSEGQWLWRYLPSPSLPWKNQTKSLVWTDEKLLLSHNSGKQLEIPLANPIEANESSAGTAVSAEMPKGSSVFVSDWEIRLTDAGEVQAYRTLKSDE